MLIVGYCPPAGKNLPCGWLSILRGSGGELAGQAETLALLGAVLTFRLLIERATALLEPANQSRSFYTSGGTFCQGTGQQHLQTGDLLLGFCQVFTKSVRSSAIYHTGQKVYLCRPNYQAMCRRFFFK
jgi:hypothetical protein